MTALRQDGFSGILVIIALLIAALLYFGYSRLQSGVSEKKTTITAIDASRAVACRSNRVNIERDIQLWLVDHPGEAPTLAALEATGVRIPPCPEGGAYAVDGVHVRCSKHE